MKPKITEEEITEPFKYNCDRCDFKSKWKSAYIRHVRNIHEGPQKGQEKIFSCSESSNCTYKTTRRENFNRHVRIKHRNGKKKKQCSYCDFSTYSQTYLDTHIRKHRGEAIAKHHCSVCKLGYISQADFQNHLEEFHPVQGSVDLQ